MSESQPLHVGQVAAIWRYPVKSMLGQSLDAVQTTTQGLQGDRALALIDRETGKVASAKNPRVWPGLFAYRASYLSPAGKARSLPLVRIDLPDGESLTTDQQDAEDRLSAELGRGVRLAPCSGESFTSEGYWPDDAWLEHRDEVFEFPLPQGTFFDGAPIHLLTTATLARLAASSPESRWETPRFRPNFVIETPVGMQGFVEDEWLGKTLTLGEATLQIERPCPRCIMTTLGQGDLPKDSAVLRTAVQENAGNVGVYATVLAPGQVRCGDAVQLD